MKIKLALIVLTFLAGWPLHSAAQNKSDTASAKVLAADSKSGYIAHNGDPTIHIETTEMSGVSVRVHGNTAVVTGAYHEKGVSKGKPYEYRDRFTDVWMNLTGKWQVIVSHYSIPAQ